MRDEKYTRTGEYLRAKARRGVMRAAIRGLVRWEPLRECRPGYSVIIGCNSRLLPMVSANLAMLTRQDLTDLDTIFVVLDRPEGEVAPGFEATLRERFPELPVRVLSYTPAQAKRAAAFDWGWIYSWMSWSLGIAAARTRWAILHDFDALLLRPTMLAERYRAIRDREVEYLGMRYYTGGGVVPDDRLVTTFELAVDVRFVRRTFRPIDLFNNVRRFDGRRVEFDTFLHAQSVAGQRDVLMIDEEWMVHPSQMICQFVEFVNGRRVPPGTNNMLMIPYYFHLGGDFAPLREVTEQLGRGGATRARLFGRELDIAALTPEHIAWCEKQAGRVEAALHGDVRPEVRAYFGAVGAARGAVQEQAS